MYVSLFAHLKKERVAKSLQHKIIHANSGIYSAQNVCTRYQIDACLHLTCMYRCVRATDAFFEVLALSAPYFN